MGVKLYYFTSWKRLRVRSQHLGINRSDEGALTMKVTLLCFFGIVAVIYSVQASPLDQMAHSDGTADLLDRDDGETLEVESRGFFDWLFNRCKDNDKDECTRMKNDNRATWREDCARDNLHILWEECPDSCGWCTRKGKWRPWHPEFD